MRKSAKRGPPRARPPRRPLTPLEALRAELARAGRDAFKLGAADHAAGRHRAPLFVDRAAIAVALKLSRRAAAATVSAGPELHPVGWALELAYIAGRALASATPDAPPSPDREPEPEPMSAAERWARLGSDWSSR